MRETRLALESWDESNGLCKAGRRAAARRRRLGPGLDRGAACRRPGPDLGSTCAAKGLPGTRLTGGQGMASASVRTRARHGLRRDRTRTDWPQPWTHRGPRATPSPHLSLSGLRPGSVAKPSRVASAAVHPGTRARRPVRRCILRHGRFMAAGCTAPGLGQGGWARRPPPTSVNNVLKVAGTSPGAACPPTRTLTW